MISSASRYSERRRGSLMPWHGRARVVQRVVGPRVAEVEAAHDALDERRGARAGVVGLALHEHRRHAAVRLDVVGLEAQRAEPSR
jgi:hypothetical protein